MSEHSESIEALRRLFPHKFQTPQIDSSTFLAPGCVALGDVTIGKGSSIWFNTVLRADVNYIRIGERTNVQDLSLVHVDHQKSPVIIGNDVTIGHCAIIHACKIGSLVLIGMGSIILGEAEIGDNVILGAGSLVTHKMKIPSGTKAFGRPAKVVGRLNEEERERIRESALHYFRLARVYLGSY